MVGMRKISKRYYFRQIIACWLVFYMLFCFGMPVQVAMAEVVMTSNPTGTITVTPLNAGITQDMTATHGAIGNFSSFDIAVGHTVDCAMDASAQALFRVSGPGTEILGTFNANGGIWLINPAGILVGSSGAINVNSLVASSLKITDEAFTSGLTTGSFQFTDGVGAGNVINEGTITAERIALIAKNVINRGHIVAGECAIMAAGDTVLISENSPVAVEVTMGADWAPDNYSVYQVKNVDGDGIEVGQGGEMATAQVVLAAGDIWSAALVKASAGGSEAVATIDIDAAGDVTVTDKVVAEAFGSGENNATATVTVNSGGDVQVIAKAEVGDESVRQALIQAKTLGGATNTSEILICAEGQVAVEAQGGWEDIENDIWHGSTASIEAIAGPVKSTTLNNTAMVLNTTGEGMAQNNTADVQIGAGEGINVTAISDFYTTDSFFSTEASASIKAEAAGGVENTAGILACANGDVQVIAERGGEAMISSVAGALQGTSSNAETTLISHTGDVVVDSSLGGNASIKSVVNGDGTTTATTQLYATDVKVTGEDASIKAGDDPLTQKDDGFTFCATTDGRIAETDGSGTLLLIIDGSDSLDCPDCPPCPCEEELLAPVAPLAQFEIPRVEGCPELTQAAAVELGITAETIQVAIGNALALNPTIQPCQACAALVDAAAILRDEDGSRMAAMVQAFNALAPADAPFTPEMATSIAMAFEGAAEGTQYASVMEYIDAFVQYVAVLDTELGSPVGEGESVAFVMGKYGAGIAESENSNIAAFVAARLAALGG